MKGERMPDMKEKQKNGEREKIWRMNGSNFTLAVSLDGQVEGNVLKLN